MLKHKTLQDESTQKRIRAAFSTFSGGEVIVFKSDDEDKRELMQNLFSEVFETMGFGGGMDWDQIEEAGQKAIEGDGSTEALTLRAVHPAQKTVRHAKEIAKGLCPIFVTAPKDYPTPVNDIQVTVLVDEDPAINPPTSGGSDA